MRSSCVTFAPLALLAAVACDAQVAPPAKAIAWRAWSPELFADARRDGRLVLLDLGTGWCHWCHVMEETTYRDREVVALIRDHYVAAKVDADAQLDLANRYEDYGWPATVIFDSKGTELVKMRGYLEPERLASLLQACVDDPTPGPSARESVAPPVAAAATALPADLRARLEAAHLEEYDPKFLGFGRIQKYLPEWSVEHDLDLARRGDAAAAKRVRETLAANRKLIDPAWGGVYQYSHGGDWDHPHFEKIMSFQALNLRLYAQAHALFGEPADLDAVQRIRGYLTNFLRGPDGAFFTSQDADLVDGEHGGDYFALDDAGRRARGLPRIDRNVYARENGWAIEALAVVAEFTGDGDALAQAVAAARAIVATRAGSDGSFRHGERDAEAGFLGDTLAMAAALFELHVATGDPTWLAQARASLAAIRSRFGGGSDGGVGFPTALARADASGALPLPQHDENLVLARLAHRVFLVTGDPRCAAMRTRALRYLLESGVALRHVAGGTLLVADAIERDPVHVTVVGAHDDPGALALLRVALRFPTRDKVVVAWDPLRDPPLPDGQSYPVGAAPAAFVCVAGSCSPPVGDAGALAQRLERSRGR